MCVYIYKNTYMCIYIYIAKGYFKWDTTTDWEITLE